MRIEFKGPGDTGLLTALAAAIGCKLQGNTLVLPSKTGSGYVRGYHFNGAIKMMVHRFTLKKDVTLRRPARHNSRHRITLSFHQVFSAITGETKSRLLPGSHVQQLPSVQVTSGDMDFEIFFPAGTAIHTIIITIQVELLKELLNGREGHALLQTIVTGAQPYLYEAIISPAIRDAAGDIVQAAVPEQLQDFYCRVKAEELVCLFFAELIKRESRLSLPLHTEDVKKIYSVRDALLADISVPPSLPALARMAGMSESKMKRLFRQIFGNSIYNYYQHLRMKEAAYLIKEKKQSVSETGYRLGFTNLSHFTRLFEKHLGMKPKKYALAHLKAGTGDTAQ
jgi:AraC-like DNA-binding protein